jgi:PAS domain S-box-containing protein
MLASLFEAWQSFFAHLRTGNMPIVLEMLAQATHASYASLMSLDEDEQVLTIQSATGQAPATTANRVKLGEGMAGWVAQNSQALVLQRGADGPAVIQEAMQAEQIASAICVPLEEDGHVLGVLTLLRYGDNLPFTPQDLGVASMLADRIALTLHNAKLASQLESRERFINRILESVPSSLLVIDRGLRIVSVNRNFLDKARRETQTTLGRKIEQVFPHVLVEYTRLDQKVRDIFRTGQPVEGGKVAYRAPGIHTRIYYYRLIPLKVGEKVENVMLLMDDITEREQLSEEVRRAERHLASVVECANDLVVSIDPQGRIVTWNPAAERASGLNAEEAKGRSLISLCAVEHQPVMADMLQGLVRGEKVRNTEVSFLTVSGRELPIAWSCSPMLDDDGKVMGIVAVGRDLTERRQLEAQLIQSDKMASLGAMAGGIAHEVRNPLGIISASAQLLLERPDDVELRNECARKIHASTQRASLIIESLLKFARPRGERMREIDLHAVLEDTFNLLSHQMALQKVALVRVFQPNLPSLYGNLELLQQVFTNLILNACNAMPNGGTLTVVTRSTEAGLIEIWFKDTGCGISPEYLSRVFDPFFTTMPVGKGVGLGLSISYSIIQQHHGTIQVTSQVGQGATFTVRLPRRFERP